MPPSGPPSKEGQLAFRTTDKKLFLNIGGSWVELGLALAPPPPGAIAVVNGGIDVLEVGEVVRADPGMPGQVIRASGAAESEAFVVGLIEGAPIPPAAVGTAASVQGILVPDVQFETGLAGVVTGALVYLSVLTAGALTVVDPVVAPGIIGTVRKVMGVVWDGSSYIGGVPADSKATIQLRDQELTVIS